MESSELVIQATGLKKSFDDKQVLNGVDLQIPRGSIVGLIGTNGAGKSTLLKCLLGLLKITDGWASVYGENPWDLSEATKAKLGYVPQVVKFYPWMNVQQMVNYTAAHYESWDQQTADQMLKDFDLKLTDKVKILSTGQQQRLGLVLAMGYHPELLILDEPAASLDPAGRRTLLRSLLEHSQNDQQTALFSTHITSDLERVASHVAILRNGVIDFFGELEDLKDSVKRLRISGQFDLPKNFSVPSTLRSEIHGSTAVVSVAAADADLISQIEQDWNVQVTVENLNLEDIFLELHDEQD